MSEEVPQNTHECQQFLLSRAWIKALKRRFALAASCTSAVNWKAKASSMGGIICTSQGSTSICRSPCHMDGKTIWTHICYIRRTCIQVKASCFQDIILTEEGRKMSPGESHHILRYICNLSQMNLALHGSPWFPTRGISDFAT